MGDIGSGTLWEGLAGVTWLATGLASGVFASHGFGFTLQSAAGGRLAAIGAVHVEALFKLRDTGLEGSNERDRSVRR